VLLESIFSTYPLGEKGRTIMAWEQWEPQRFFGTLRREVDKVFEDFFGSRAPHHPHRHRRSEAGEVLEPAVEVIETPAAIVVRAQVPGVAKEHLSVEVSPAGIRLTGESQVEAATPDQRYHLQEICYGTFARTVPVPVPVESDQATATLRDGILQVMVPKSPQERGKSVKIDVA
jgi:HSP20 family protein